MDTKLNEECSIDIDIILILSYELLHRTHTHKKRYINKVDKQLR